MIVQFDIPDEQVSRVTAALKFFFPIPEDESGDPLFTDNQWAKESLRRYVVEQVNRHEVYVAKNAVTIATDHSLVS